MNVLIHLQCHCRHSGNFITDVAAFSVLKLGNTPKLSKVNVFLDLVCLSFAND